MRPGPDLSIESGVLSCRRVDSGAFPHCPGGEIGRHRRLKISRSLRSYRFDSGPGHQETTGLSPLLSPADKVNARAAGREGGLGQRAPTMPARYRGRGPRAMTQSPRDWAPTMPARYRAMTQSPRDWAPTMPARCHGRGPRATSQSPRDWAPTMSARYHGRGDRATSQSPRDWAPTMSARYRRSAVSARSQSLTRKSM